MESTLDTGPVVVAKMPNVIYNMGNLVAGNLDFTQRNLFARESGLGVPAEVEHDLKEVPDVFPLTQCGGDFFGKNVDEGFQVVDNLCVGIYQLERLLVCLICQICLMRKVAVN